MLQFLLLHGLQNTVQSECPESSMYLRRLRYKPKDEIKDFQSQFFFHLSSVAQTQFELKGVPRNTRKAKINII